MGSMFAHVGVEQLPTVTTVTSMFPAQPRVYWEKALPLILNHWFRMECEEHTHGWPSDLDGIVLCHVPVIEYSGVVDLSDLSSFIQKLILLTDRLPNKVISKVTQKRRESEEKKSGDISQSHSIENEKELSKLLFIMAAAMLGTEDSSQFSQFKEDPQKSTDEMYWMSKWIWQTHVIKEQPPRMTVEEMKKLPGWINEFNQLLLQD